MSTAAIVISVTYLAHSRSRSVVPSSALSPLSLLVVVGAHAQCSPPSLFGGVDVDVVVAAAAAAVLRISCVLGSLHPRPLALSITSPKFLLPLVETTDYVPISNNETSLNAVKWK